MKSPLEQTTKKCKPCPCCIVCNNHNHSMDKCKRNPTNAPTGDESSMGGGNENSGSKGNKDGSETEDEDDNDKGGEHTSDDEVE